MAATKRQIADLNAQVTASAKQYIDELAKAGRFTQRTAQGMTRDMRGAAAGTQSFTTQTTAAVAASKTFGRGLQNVGFQVQDFAVQVASGQGAMRAFSQQAPQLLGAFGPAGAIAGAVVAVGALAGNLLLASRNAKSAKEEVLDLATVLSTFRETRDRISLDRLSPEGKRDKFAADIAQRRDEIAKLSDFVAREQAKQNALREATRPQAFAGPGALDAQVAQIRRIEKVNTEELAAAQTRIIALRTEILDLTEKQTDAEKEAAAQSSKANDAQTKRLTDLRKYMLDYVGERNAQAEAERVAAEQRAESYRREGEAITRSLRTPLERYNDEIAKLNANAERGAISQETLRRGIAAAGDELIAAQRKAAGYRSEVLSLSEIVNAGAGSSNAERAQRAIGLRDRATAAEARGNFALADELRNRAAATESAIVRRERLVDPATGLTVGATNLEPPRPVVTTPDAAGAPGNGGAGAGVPELVSAVRQLIQQISDLPRQIGVA